VRHADTKSATWLRRGRSNINGEMPNNDIVNTGNQMLNTGLVA
jgi:hypothetical protein